MLEYRIVKAGDQDLAFLEEMLYQAVYVPPGEEKPPRNITRKPELYKYVFPWSQEADSGLIALDAEGKKLGAAWLKLLTADNPGWGYIGDTIPELCLALLPEYRGRGIGSALLKQLIAETREKYPKISLSVDPRNEALRLYQHLGFVACGKAGDSVLMLRSESADLA